MNLLARLKRLLKFGDVTHATIVPAKLKQVFEKWVVKAGHGIDGMDNDNYALLFFAKLIHASTTSAYNEFNCRINAQRRWAYFILAGKMYELKSQCAYLLNVCHYQKFI